MSEEDKVLNFDEFRRAVGASEPTVRMAVKMMRLEPRMNISDRRQKLYPKAWIPQVQEWIRQNLAS